MTKKGGELGSNGRERCGANISSLKDSLTESKFYSGAYAMSSYKIQQLGAQSGTSKWHEVQRTTQVLRIETRQGEAHTIATEWRWS